MSYRDEVAAIPQAESGQRFAPEQVLTPDQLGHMLHVHSKTIIAMAKEGRLPHIAVGSGTTRRHIRFLLSDVLQHLREKESVGR